MSEPNSTIKYPDVPTKEKDPLVRINTMIRIFNAGLPSRESRSGFDSGFYHEIQSALRLVREHKITSGDLISRPLTASEKEAGKKGNSQMVLVPLEGDKFRELDMVYEEEGVIHIVEAKNTKTAATKQVEGNIELAKKLKGKVVYALAGEKKSQGKALKEVHKMLGKDNAMIPALDIINIPADGFARLYFEKEVAGLLTLASSDAIMDSSFNPDTGEEYEEQSFLANGVDKKQKTGKLDTADTNGEEDGDEDDGESEGDDDGDSDDEQDEEDDDDDDDNEDEDPDDDSNASSEEGEDE